MKRSEESAPGASDVTFEWQYSCPSGKACSFSTARIPRANGFSLTTGISTLSCQVNGMELDYSGSRKSQDDSAPTASVPSQKRPEVL
jgi:hypothetical protein